MKYKGIEKIAAESKTANIAPMFAKLQVSVDLRTGECWSAWNLVNNWEDYHDDHIITAVNLYGPTTVAELREVIDMAVSVVRSEGA